MVQDKKIEYTREGYKAFKKLWAPRMLRDTRTYVEAVKTRVQAFGL